MIQAITDVLLIVLKFLFDLTQNYGLAIILLTILVRTVTLPLSHKQIQSSRAMQKIQPEVKKLQEKYKDDPEKLNEETIKLWKKYNTNPLAGCLPLIVQIPILYAMFQLLQKPEVLVAAINNFDPYMFPAQKILNLNNPDPTYILPLLAGASTFFQQKTLTTTDPSQKGLLIAMPIMITIFSLRFPAGLVIYWVVSNIISLGQHYLLGKPVLKGELKNNENS